MPSRVLVVDDSATVRSVVTGILERNGYDVVAAADGQSALEALTGEPKEVVDLVLLDFVMPRMNGYQFCRAIRQNGGALATLPIVLMSAKSDKIRDQFVQQTGAMDALSKPFDAQALVCAIENALRRMESGRASAARLPELDDDDLVDAAPSSSPGVEHARRARVASEIGARVAKAIAPALTFLPPDARGDAELVGRAITQHLDPDALLRMLGALRDLDPDDARKPTLAGDFGTIPIGAVLQLLQVEGQSGVMIVSNRNGSPSIYQEVTITFRGGLIDMVQSRGTTDEFRLGRYFVEEGLVTPQEIEKILAERASAEELASAPPPSGDLRTIGPADATLVEAPLDRTAPDGMPSGVRLLGDRLLAAGRVSEEQLRDALVRQSSELVYEMLRWQKGRFVFRRRAASSLAAAAKLGLTVPAVVMEGFRRVDEWRTLEGKLGNFDAVLVRDPLALDGLPQDKLVKAERAVVEAIDGQRSIREVIAASHMSSFDACRILVQLLEARLVRRKNVF